MDSINIVLIFHFLCLLVGILCLPIAVSGDSVAERMEIATEKPDNFTIVVFGTNSNDVLMLVSLLSDDGHLDVQKRDDKVIVIANPTNAAWTPDPKYIICSEVQPARISNYLSGLKKPLKFVVLFDIGDMFMDPFWEILFTLAEFKAQDKIYSNRLQMIGINIPHDGISLQQRCEELKISIKNALQNRWPTDFQMAVMHTITKSGPVSGMPELRDEVAVIKNAVDQ